MNSSSGLICLSQQRWGVMSRRPQRVMLECSAERRVFFVEPPRFDAELVHGTITRIHPNLLSVVPHLRHGASAEVVRDQQRALLMEVVEAYDIRRPILWFDSLLPLEFSSWLPAALTIYDSMSEPLAGGLRALEAEMLGRADLVFTSDVSSYEARRGKHPSVHMFPNDEAVALKHGAQNDAQQEAHFAGASSADTWALMSRLIEQALSVRAA